MVTLADYTELLMMVMMMMMMMMMMPITVIMDFLQ